MIKIIKIISVTGIVFCALILLSASISLPWQDFHADLLQSVKIYDRNGIFLREIFNEKEGRGEWKKLNEISPYAIKATIASEDKRFFVHPGFDPIAIIRAVYRNVANLSVVSGGSTISQQVIRNIYNHPRSLKYKFLEIWLALRLENMFSKNEILEQYLNRVQFGNQTFGIESAARLYFDKSAKNLSIAEAAFLAGLPNSPTINNPYKNLNRGIKKQKYVLERMLACNFISESEYTNALSEPLRIVPPEKQFKAPHFVEMVKQVVDTINGRNISEIHTTLDLNLQSSVEFIVRNHLNNLKNKNVTNASVLILDNKTNEVICLVGSANYFDSANSGQVNGASALRQPGSAIKPFIYALAFETGSSPSDVINDKQTALTSNNGTYYPENYDRKYHGLITLRTALACSYNIPAVITAEKIGVSFILDKLIESGFTSLKQTADYYGVGLTLGNGEVTLTELTRAYSIFARGGMLFDVKLISSMKDANGNNVDSRNIFCKPKRIFSDESSYLVTNILSDNVARSPAFGDASPLNLPFPCAVKTGTTKDYRDNWTVGYTSEFTVGVWVGNFNGQSMKYISGVSGAGQIFHDAMMLMNNVRPAKEFSRPCSIMETNICIESSNLAGPLCVSVVREIFTHGSEPNMSCPLHKTQGRATAKNSESTNYLAVKVNNDKPRILYPNSGDIFKIDPILRSEFQTLKLQTSYPNGAGDLQLIVDENQSVGLNEDGSYRWQLQKGKHTFRLEVINQKILSNKIEIFVQ